MSNNNLAEDTPEKLDFMNSFNTTPIQNEGPFSYPDDIPSSNPQISEFA
jgi:hypothetical protein